MSDLVFVRHGQASFGADSYDKLSELGIQQVRLLAEHWQSIGERFDVLYCGQLQRQRETAAGLTGLGLDGELVPIENSDFNEYNGDPLIEMFLRDHASDHDIDPIPEFPIRDEKTFREMFEHATAKWIRDELMPQDHDTEFEPWRDFQNRVYRAMDEIMEKHQRGSRVLISTSGGVIAMALQRVLGFPDQQVINTNWMVHNSSVTRMKYGNGKLTLMQFNSLPHLDRPDRGHMTTYM